MDPLAFFLFFFSLHSFHDFFLFLSVTMFFIETEITQGVFYLPKLPFLGPTTWPFNSFSSILALTPLEIAFDTKAWGVEVWLYDSQVVSAARASSDPPGRFLGPAGRMVLAHAP